MDDTFRCGHDRTLANLTYDRRCRECKRARDRLRTERNLESERARKRVFTRWDYYRRQGREVPGPPRPGNYRKTFPAEEVDHLNSAG